MASAALFDRRCRLTIASPVDDPANFKETKTDVIEIDGGATDETGAVGMRIQFEVQKTLKKEPNTGKITITNLSPDRRASLQRKGVKVLLEAGHRDTGMFRVFSGDVRAVDHERMDADWETVLQLGDGERAWQFARASESLAPGTPKAEALRRAARAMGLNLGNLDRQLANVSGSFDQGFVLHGPASRILDTVTRSMGLDWSIQDGELQILRKDEALDRSVAEISPTSGLIGSPEMGSPRKKGKPALVKFRSLLTPTKPGAKVKLVSSRYDGFVRVEGATFSGDSSGGPWYTDFAGVIHQ